MTNEVNQEYQLQPPYPEQPPVEGYAYSDNNFQASIGGYGYSYGSPQPPVISQQKDDSGKAVASLVCGILAILFSPTIIIGIILGILAIVFAGQYSKLFKGNAGNYGASPDSKATGGKVCGIIGLVFSLFTLFIMLLALIIGIAAYTNSSSYYFPSYSSVSGQEITANFDYSFDNIG